MKQYFKKLFLPLTFARRDMRRGMRGFYIFLGCLVLGVAAIATIQSVSRGLVESLHHDGRYILGGDIAYRTIYEPAPLPQIQFLQQKLGPVTVVMETRAMARNEDETAATLTELKAVDPFYPLYGKLKIVDMDGAEITTGLQELILPKPDGKGGDDDIWGALIEKELLSRLNIKINDWVWVGKQKFIVRGIIAKEPDRIGSLRFALAPRIMISKYTFDRTGLKQLGSQVYYDHKVVMPYVKTFKDLANAQAMVAAAFPDARWQGRDFLSASPQVERLVGRLTLFLTLIGLTTLLIGGVGISNAVRSFLDSKLADIATLKCLGAPEKFVFRLYLTQIFILATLGILLGLAMAVGISQLAGTLLTEKLSLTDQVGIYPSALLLAAGFGYLTTFCFSLWPIGRAVKVSPRDLFRDLIAPVTARPAVTVILWTLIAAQLLALLAIISVDDQRLVIFFAIGTLLVFAIFYLYAAVMKRALKHLKPQQKPEWRMAIANLYRPGNISTSVVLSLGLGLTVLIAIALIQFNFTRLIQKDISADAPSFFMLDIEPGQRDAFKEFVAATPTTRKLLLMPSFRGRIVAVNGVAAEKALVDKSEEWVISSDRGFTYTDTLPSNSRIVEGEWWSKAYQGAPLVSIATDVAKAFNIGVGAKITVNILGMDVVATVANVREIEWGSFTLNFAVTFAPGFLEKIPSNYMATLIIAEDQEQAFQTNMAKKFQNVTAVRVRDALAAAQTIIRAIAQAVALSAAVTLVAGTLVLAGGIAAARRRHLYDAIVLKVLGATKARILKTFLLEYGILGALTVVISAVLGTLAAYSLQTFVMELPWKFSWTALLSVITLSLTITLTAGFLGTWRALQQKPAQHLKNQ